MARPRGVRPSIMRAAQRVDKASKSGARGGLVLVAVLVLVGLLTWWFVSGDDAESSPQANIAGTSDAAP